MTARRIGGWTVTELGAFAGLIVGYGITLAIGRAMVDDGDPDWKRWAIAGTTIAFALAAVGLAIRRGRRTQELDRFLFSESTSIAFFATMLSAVTYGLLESLVDAPRLSAWSTWGFGMTAWGVTSVWLQRSMR